MSLKIKISALLAEIALRVDSELPQWYYKVVGGRDPPLIERHKVFTITIADDTYEMDHSDACEFLDNLGIIGLEACRDAEDFKYATYFGDDLTPVFIEYHTDSRI